MCMGKSIVRYGVITALAGGAAVLVAGPDRVGAILHQTREKINTTIDANIKDPVALRSQLRSLEKEYPERIGEVRGDLAELREQKSQLERDLEVSRRVVALAEADLSQIQPLLAKAEATTTQVAGVSTNVSMNASGNAPMPVVRVVFANESMSMDEAYAKAQRMQQVRGAYASRAADIEHDLGYIGQQEQRLGELLTQLETEHASFQTQIWDLDRQIDAISRNERLIEVMKDREETIEQHSRYRAASLEQLQSRFAEIRTKQEATLQSLAKARTGVNYEDRAKIEMDVRGSVKPQTFELRPAQPQVIEIRPDSNTSDAKPTTARVD